MPFPPSPSAPKTLLAAEVMRLAEAGTVDLDAAASTYLEHPQLPPTEVLPFGSIATLAGAAGGVASDAATIARWGHLLHGGQVLGAATTREMRESPREDGYGLGSGLLPGASH